MAVRPPMPPNHTLASATAPGNRDAERLFALSLDLLCLVDLDGHFRRVNPAFERALGWTGEELLARPFMELVHPDDRDATAESVRRFAAGLEVEAFENRSVCKDGTHRWLAWRAVPSDEPGLLYAVARDITDSRRAAAALRASEGRYRSLFDQSPMSVVIFDTAGRPVQCNPAFERIVGTGLESLPAGYTAFTDPQLAGAGMLPLTERAFAGEIVTFPPCSYDVAALGGYPGRVTWIQSTAYPLRNEAGAVEQVVLMTEDVTPRLKADAERRASDERFRLVKDASPDAFVIWDAVRGADGTVVDFVLGYANRAFERTFGRPVTELKGQAMLALFPNSKPSGRFATYVQVLETGITTESVIEYEGDGRSFRFTVVRVGDGIGLTTTDVTARVQAERVLRRSSEELERVVQERTLALRESEERFRSLTENSLDVISILAADGTIRYGSQGYEKVFGYRLEDITGTSVFDLVHPDDRAATAAVFQRLLEHPEETQTTELRVQRPDGTDVWVQAFGQNRLADSAVRGIVINSRDITAQHVAMETAQRAEAMFRGLTQQSITGSYIGQDDRVLYGNPKFAEIFGYEAGELLSLTGRMDLIAPEEHSRVAEMLQHRLLGKGDVQYTTLGLRKDGTRVPIEVYGSAFELDGRPATVATVLDISDRVRAEAALRESEARFRIAFEQGGTGVALSRPDGRFEKVNAALCELLGYSEEELLTLTFHDVTHPEDRADSMRQARNALVDAASYQLEKRYVKKSGEIVWILLTSSLHRADDGQPLYFIGQAQDITAHKLAEARLQASEERFKLAVAGASDGIWDWDLAKNEAYLSPTWKAQLGYAEHELGDTFKEWETRVHPDDLAGARSRLDDYFAGRVERFELEHRVRHRDGSYRWILARAAAVRDDAGRVLRLVGTNTDRTERKQLEESVAEQAHELAQRNAQLARQATELQRSNEELERFAYAASHDLQEPLRMVTSFTGLLAKRYEGQLDAQAQQYIHFASDGATRMNRLIQDLLAYSRVGSRGGVFTAIDIGAVLADVLRTLQLAIDESGATITHDPLPVAWADATQVGQVFQNLLGNALKFRGAAAPVIHVGLSETGGAWRFSVRDNGIGLEPKHSERIFIMFQRLHTRVEYPGTGMGLALCRRVVERHGGRIWVDSTIGQGATFHFTLPRSAPTLGSVDEQS